MSTLFNRMSESRERVRQLEAERSAELDRDIAAGMTTASLVEKYHLSPVSARVYRSNFKRYGTWKHPKKAKRDPLFD